MSLSWPKSEIAALFECVRDTNDVYEALGNFEKRTGRRLTIDAANGKLRRMGFPFITALLGRKKSPATEWLAKHNAHPASKQEPKDDPDEQVSDRVRPIGVDPDCEGPRQVRDGAPPEAWEKDHLTEHRLKTKVAELTAAKKQLLKDIADREEQLETLRELRAAVPIKPIKAIKKVDAHQRQGVAVMFCSDWHVEEPVDIEKVNGLNRYNLEIADQCISMLPDAFEWLVRDTRYDCRTAIVALGGDLLSGYIHEELVEANFLSPVQASLWLQERIEKMLRKIAALTKFERIIVPCVDGNHGRLTNKTRVSTRTANSLEWLIYQSIAARMADDPRFEFQIAGGEWLFMDVMNTSLAITHGDTFNYQGGVGGISIPLRRGINEMRKYRKIDVTVLGHFHQRQDFGDIVVNGSMIGVNPYSMHIHASPEPRQQTFFMIDSERGKCLNTPVWLPESV